MRALPRHTWTLDRRPAAAKSYGLGGNHGRRPREASRLLNRFVAPGLRRVVRGGRSRRGGWLGGGRFAIGRRDRRRRQVLATDKPDSAHLLAPKIKARLYFAIASNDDAREPEVKDKLEEAFAAAKVRAEIEVYPNALHGWCVPDDKLAFVNQRDAERAWGKLVALYKAAL